jgi:hypothetical protein
MAAFELRFRRPAAEAPLEKQMWPAAWWRGVSEIVIQPPFFPQATGWG